MIGIMTPQDYVKAAQDRADWSWVFFHIMSQEDKQAFDSWLVESEHPLAYEPGTTEKRFRAMVHHGES